MRLGWTDNKIIHTLKFKITKNGFDIGELNLSEGLIATGSVEEKNKFIRLNHSKTDFSQAGIWHQTRQNIQNGFDMTTEIKFRRGANFGTVLTL